MVRGRVGKATRYPAQCYKCGGKTKKITKPGNWYGLYECPRCKIYQGGYI